MTYTPDIAKDLPQEEDDIQFPEGEWLSDEPPMETELHLRQMLLLIQCLDWLWRDRTDYYACGNLTIYYSQRCIKSEDFRGPDFFVVLNTERYPRKSWVVWQEDGKYPNVIIELLSNKTAKTDKGLKKQIYQDVFRTPEYFWFSPYTLEFAGFSLVAGGYEPMSPNEQGQLWSQQLELYLGVREKQLRFFTPEGNLVPTPEESAIWEQQQAEQARAQAQQARAQAQQARAQANRLATKLRELGIDPETLDQ
jgi:Uma2 family endonuclease